jgi:hypothetical protein
MRHPQNETHPELDCEVTVNDGANQNSKDPDPEDQVFKVRINGLLAGQRRMR